MVCGISGEGDWDDDVVNDVSPVVVGRRRESVEGEGWRRGVVPDFVADDAEA